MIARHPLITTAVLAVAGAAALILAFILIVVPLMNAVNAFPGQVAHAYVDYWNGVGREFAQARQKDGGGAP